MTRAGALEDELADRGGPGALWRDAGLPQVGLGTARIHGGGIGDCASLPSPSRASTIRRCRGRRPNARLPTWGDTSTPMLLDRSRHASVPALERYAHPGIDAVARHVAQGDPAARRKRKR
ncbi:hypothetical protein GCM10010358_77300 [Streptomyces minutiscleroticus]|uniref:Integrase n=1 Tax=Streptomyces minutiscleroticus TaxID=68238 RepID=A0A918P223_9ACTN|nr:hypothetical protein GCM10010358_77300 [Streptomyces minutiscleroticus]